MRVNNVSEYTDTEYKREVLQNDCLQLRLHKPHCTYSRLHTEQLSAALLCTCYFAYMTILRTCTVVSQPICTVVDISVATFFFIDFETH